MENKKKKKGRNIEHKTDQRKPQIDEKPMENNITTPTNQRAWEVIWVLPVNTETHNGGNGVHSGGNGVHSGEEVRWRRSTAERNA